MMATTDQLVVLARLAGSGDTAALSQLLEELEPIVVHTARLIVGSGSWVAEDAAQDALVDIAKSLADVRNPDGIRRWAIRVATRRAIKVSRRERVLSLRRSPAIDLELLPGDQSEYPNERLRAIKDAFDRLPPRLRATAVLRLHLALSEADTAAILDCRPQTVRSNLHRARAKLVRALNESGFAPMTMSQERSASVEK